MGGQSGRLETILSNEAKEFSSCFYLICLQDFAVMIEKSLHVSLEEFGLSRYEARAYLAMVKRGSVSASELAYYADIPRSKVYPILSKLETKGLAVISGRNPIECKAMAPEDAFDDIIQDQINKVNAMNALLSDLKKVSEEGKREHGTEEGRYVQLSADSVLSRLRTMIGGARSSIRIIADQSGMSLLSECREDVLGRLRGGIDVRMIVPLEAVGSDSFKAVPRGIDLRASESAHNCIIFDDVEMFMIDSDTGRGSVFTAAGVPVACQDRVFLQMWEAATGVESLLDLKRADAQEILRAVRLVGGDSLPHVLGSGADGGRRLLNMLESGGIRLRSRTLAGVVYTVDAILHMTCSGGASLDAKSSTITVESGSEGSDILAWVAILDEYLHGRDCKTRIVHRDGTRTYIKIDSAQSSGI